MMPYGRPWPPLQLTGQADFRHPTGRTGRCIRTRPPGVGTHPLRARMPGLYGEVGPAA
jgi:hypothetical protein